MKVLIAEDSRAIAEAMAYCLRRHGHVVELAADGEAALAALRGDGVELLVLDLGLPKVDGAEVLRAARERSPRLPVLVSSARDDGQAHLARLGLSADAYVGKPFSVADFERIVAQLAWRFGLAEHEAAALPLADGERCLLKLLWIGEQGWIDAAEIARGLAAGGVAAAPDEIERCIEGLRDKLAERAPVRLVKVRGLGYGLVAAD